MEEKIQSIIEQHEAYAAKENIRVNPDSQLVEALVRGMLMNEERHGDRYCPCRLVTGDPEKDRKNVCPCVYHKDEIARDGHCHCRLFLAK
jgi:ferredoxin-thioredoxin reductase catalytic chain